jgi:hypothetical protein
MKKMDAPGDALSAVLSDLSDKYIPRIWERRKYAYREVQRCPARKTGGPFWELTMSALSWRKSD